MVRRVPRWSVGMVAPGPWSRVLLGAQQAGTQPQWSSTQPSTESRRAANQRPWVALRPGCLDTKDDLANGRLKEDFCISTTLKQRFVGGDGAGGHTPAHPIFSFLLIKAMTLH